MKRHLRRALVLLGSLVSASVLAAQIESLTLARPEGERHLLLANPARPPGEQLPLVIVLHGHGGSAAQVLGQRRTAAPLSRWLDVADSEGVLVAAPDGLRGGDGRTGWNDCRADAQGNPQVDDVGFVAALIDDAIARHHADPARVYVIGMSNGGLMSFRLAIELAPRLAAFAAVSASMPVPGPPCEEPRQALPALVISGTADPIMPFEGGGIGRHRLGERGGVRSVQASVDVWRRLAHLDGPPASREQLPHADAADPTRAQRIVWGADSAHVQVELVRIDGGGHVEPSPSIRIGKGYARLVGAQNGDVETAEEAWRFFRDKRAQVR